MHDQIESESNQYSAQQTSVVLSRQIEHLAVIGHEDSEKEEEAAHSILIKVG